MLVVRGRKETDLPPPLHGVQGLAPDREAVEGRREGLWKHPRAPSVKRLWKKKAAEAVLVFLSGTRVGCISTTTKPPDEECDEVRTGGESEEGGPGPP